MSYEHYDEKTRERMLEIDRRLRAGTTVLEEFDHMGVHVRIRRQFCEGTYANPGFFWLTEWRAQIDGDDYGCAMENWEPATVEELAGAVTRLRVDAIACIVGILALKEMRT